MQTRLRVGSFGGASAFPIVIAHDLGAFAQRGLRVEHSQTPDSASLRERIISGELDIVHAAPDNVIAWFDDGVDVAAWLAGSNGPISLVARTAGTIAQLSGARVGVDSPRSGFVPILRRILDGAGLGPDAVELVQLGATRHRFKALSEGVVDATMLTLPWSLMAKDVGASVLADHTSVAAGLLTSCALSSRAWLRREAAVAEAYADAIDAAVMWLRDGTDHDRAVALLAADVGLDANVAEAVLRAMIGESGGWPSHGRLLGSELRTTWELRSDAIGQPRHEPGDYVWALPPRPSG